jgi:hypothetical protein
MRTSTTLPLRIFVSLCGDALLCFWMDSYCVRLVLQLSLRRTCALCRLTFWDCRRMELRHGRRFHASRTPGW